MLSYHLFLLSCPEDFLIATEDTVEFSWQPVAHDPAATI